MAKGTRACKICGKEYPYCKTVVPEGQFRWQDVACCAEHGQEYLAKVMEARGLSNAGKKKEVEMKVEKQAPVDVKPIEQDVVVDNRADEIKDMENELNQPIEAPLRKARRKKVDE